MKNDMENSRDNALSGPALAPIRRLRDIGADHDEALELRDKTLARLREIDDLISTLMQEYAAAAGVGIEISHDTDA